jgi:hypothetical protein
MIARADKLMTLDMEKKHPSMNEEKMIEVSDKTLSLVLKKKVVHNNFMYFCKSVRIYSFV